MSDHPAIWKKWIKRTPVFFLGKFLAGGLPDRFRFGRRYGYFRELLARTEYLSGDELSEYQRQQLIRLIHHAYEHVPYYRRLFDSLRLKPRDFTGLEDLHKIPYLTKDLITRHGRDMIARGFPKRHLGFETSGGSTGNPVGFYHDRRDSFSIEWAFITDMWERISYRHRGRGIVLRGNRVSRIVADKKYWEMDAKYNWLVMSSYHLTDHTLPLYLDRIKRFQPDFIQAYPSVLQLVAEFMKRNHLPPFDTVKAILCGSESLYPWQRKLFEEVLKTRVFSWYGHSERCCLAGECEQSSVYHAYPQYGFTELVNENGGWCTEEEERGEIVATGFTNWVMPLIRYRTQDIAINTTKSCPCNREWKLIKTVEGRTQDYVIGESGQYISLTALIYAQHFAAFQRIKNMQLYQDEPGKVLVRIVEREPLQSNEIAEIVSKMETAAHGGIEVAVQSVAVIPRTRRGKYKFLIQKLETKFSHSQDE